MVIYICIYTYIHIYIWRGHRETRQREREREREREKKKVSLHVKKYVRMYVRTYIHAWVSVCRYTPRYIYTKLNLLTGCRQPSPNRSRARRDPVRSTMLQAEVMYVTSRGFLKAYSDLYISI